MNLEASVDLILSQESLMTDRFYEVLFEHNPETRQYFDGTDMKVQSIMLTMTLGAIKQHPDLSTAVQKYLRILGTKHNRKDVPREAYPKFLSALLFTLEEFHGDDWDETLAGQWRAAFHDMVKLMLEGYEQRFRT